MHYSLKSLIIPLLGVLSLSTLTTAQQYAGDNITNSLPAVAGAEIAFFKIQDSSNKTATLTNYYSLNSSGGRVDPANVKRGVIIIHGLLRDPYLYIQNVMTALSSVTDPSVTKDNVAMIAPYFANGDDKGTGYPWTSGLAAGRGSTSSALVWSGSQWASGADNQYPAYPTKITDISSYDVLDQIIQYFDNATLFPNMRQIVVAGHSLGGQTVQRYAAVGNILQTRTPVSYWTANPDSFLWFSTSRPFSTSSCSTYDNWRDGFFNYTNRYGATLVAQGRSAALDRYSSRRIAYGHGTQDFGDDSSSCGANTTGINRSERFYNFIKQFPLSCSSPGTPGGPCATVDYVNVGHDALGMMSSSAGMTRLFLDNFNGTSSFAYDAGYPRIQAGDDPYPNPSLATSTLWENKTYTGNMSYQGCWTNSNTTSLAYLAYQGNSSNTIEGCTNVCSGLGFSVAGMAWGYDCHCDNAISYNAVETADGACSYVCSGNNNEYCGGEIVLGVYSSKTLVQQQAPVAPVTVSDYTYVGCMTDDTTIRALSGISTIGVISLESCAQYCSNSGYSYFGAEYHNECFCGTSLSSSSLAAPSADCNLACAGNSSEICGGSLRLSVYNTTSTTTSTTNLTCINNVSNGTIYQTTNGSTYQILCSADSYGGDISGAASPSLAACTNACDSTSGCVAATYTGGNCWLKSSLSTSYTNSAVTLIRKIDLSCTNGAGNGTIVTASNGGQYQVLCGQDSYGGDISGAISSSISACLNTCDQTSGCVDVSYTGGKCWLKSTLSALYSNSAVVSGTKVILSTTPSNSSSSLSCADNSSDGTIFTASNGGQYNIKCSTDHYGGDLASASASSFADCVNACEANSACIDVSYVSDSSPSCWLKSSLSTAYSNANVASAEKIVS